MTKNARVIRESIAKALSLIEVAIREDPQHVDWYIHAKHNLEIADSSITFCIED